jgi:hypothetical protein
MEFSTINHVEPYALNDFDADIFITTLGYETRCTAIARLYEDKTCRKVALSRSDHPKEFSFQKNRAYYLENGFEIIPVETRVPDVGDIMGPEKRNTYGSCWIAPACHPGGITNFSDGSVRVRTVIKPPA